MDEAGRGPLAGPVVAAAAVLPRNLALGAIRLDDSKKMSEAEREEAYEVLMAHPEVYIGVSIVDHATIDRINILQATMQAMDDAVAALKTPTPLDAALVDGNRVPPRCADGSLGTRHAAAIVKGDAKCAAIAAASVVAKVTRDRIMVAAAKEYPVFGFEGHKGYPTAAHVAALVKHGPCAIHRLTFAPIKNMI